MRALSDIDPAAVDRVVAESHQGFGFVASLVAVLVGSSARQGFPPGSLVMLVRADGPQPVVELGRSESGSDLVHSFGLDEEEAELVAKIFVAWLMSHGGVLPWTDLCVGASLLGDEVLTSCGVREIASSYPRFVDRKAGGDAMARAVGAIDALAGFASSSQS